MGRPALLSRLFHGVVCQHLHRHILRTDQEVAFYTDVPNTTYEIDLYTGIMADDPSPEQGFQKHIPQVLLLSPLSHVPLAHPISLRRAEVFPSS
jgi:hypothetical protein